MGKTLITTIIVVAALVISPAPLAIPVAAAVIGVAILAYLDKEKSDRDGWD